MDGSITARTDGQIAPLRCLAPCVGRRRLGSLSGNLKDGSQLGHAKNQLAPASSTGPWTGRAPLALWGPLSGKPKGWEGKGQAHFKGDMDLV